MLEQLEPAELMELTGEDVSAAARAVGEGDGPPRRRRWRWAS
jgi:hypothetical protein